MADEFRARGNKPVSLSGGRVLAPGETGEVDTSDPHDSRLITDGHLVRVEKAAPKRVSRKAKPKEPEASEAEANDNSEKEEMNDDAS